MGSILPSFWKEVTCQALQTHGMAPVSNFCAVPRHTAQCRAWSPADANAFTESKSIPNPFHNPELNSTSFFIAPSSKALVTSSDARSPVRSVLCYEFKLNG